MSQAVMHAQGDARPGAVRGFYLHLLGYAVINALLIGVNVRTSPGIWWFQWPLVAWGIGVAAHGACIRFGWKPWPEKWEHR